MKKLIKDYLVPTILVIISIFFLFYSGIISNPVYGSLFLAIDLYIIITIAFTKSDLGKGVSEENFMETFKKCLVSGIALFITYIALLPKLGIIEINKSIIVVNSLFILEIILCIISLIWLSLKPNSKYSNISASLSMLFGMPLFALSLLAILSLFGLFPPKT